VQNPVLSLVFNGPQELCFCFVLSWSFPAISLSREAAEAARRNLQLVTDSYVQRIKSIIDLLDAQSQSLTSELDAANAAYNFLIDQMGLQRAMGAFITFMPEEQKKQWQDELKAAIQ
jgi:outer membrane protein TolC